MNDNLKILLKLAKSRTGSIPISELNEQFKNVNIQVLKYSPYFEEVKIDEVYVLRLKLEGYALANDLITDRSTRFASYSAFVVSLLALAVSIIGIFVA